MKKIIVVTGHYGSGKTNLSVNLAVNAAKEGRSVAIVDLDIVNPYFRTTDFRDLFAEKGVKLIAPDFANTNLDIPSIQFDVEQLAASEDCLIIDVGGDDAGAVALGRYAESLEKYGDQLEMFYVINQRRYLTHTPDEVIKLMYEIEAASRMKHTAIVNNTNLGKETTSDIIEASRPFAEETAKRTGIPVKYTVYPDGCSGNNAPDELPVKVYVKAIWD